MKMIQTLKQQLQSLAYHMPVTSGLAIEINNDRTPEFTKGSLEGGGYC